MIKGSNILIGNNGDVKLGDFGLSRLYHPTREHLHHYTTRVVTLWYRAPELILGEKHYTASVDIWAAACVLAELYLRKPLFPGNSESDQLVRICSVVGAPSEENFPEALIKYSITVSKQYTKNYSVFDKYINPS